MVPLSTPPRRARVLSGLSALTGKQIAQRRVVRTAGQYFLRVVIQRSESKVAAILDVQLKAADGSQTLHGRWWEHCDERILDGAELLVQGRRRGGHAFYPAYPLLSYERNFIDMPFSEFAERMLAPDPQSGLRYYYKNPTKLLPAKQQRAVHVPELRDYTAKAAATNLWISGSGLTVGLHYDPADNLNFQLKGRKSFTLYPPGIRPYYPLPMFSQTAHISGVFRSGPDPDLAKFPRFDPSTAMHFELEAGDVLYIPAYWWHQVRSLGDENLNLNFWWFPKLAKQLCNWNQALRGHIQLGLRYLKYGNIQQAPADSAKPA